MNQWPHQWLDLTYVTCAANNLITQPSCRLPDNFKDAASSLPQILRLGAFLTSAVAGSAPTRAAPDSNRANGEDLGPPHNACLQELLGFLGLLRRAFHSVASAPGFHLTQAVSLLSGMKDAFALMRPPSRSDEQEPHGRGLIWHLYPFVCLELLPAALHVAGKGLESGLSDLAKALEEEEISAAR